MAVKINHDASGRVTGVVYRDDDGALHEQKARAVCVACNVVETTRLLLLSETNLFPHGLANSSGHLGKNHMRHLAIWIRAIMPGPVNQHRGTGQQGFVRDEHRHDPKRGFAGGYLLAPTSARPYAHAGLAGWGTEAQRWMGGYPNSASLLVIGEDPPEESNSITLHPTDKDEWGLPIPVLEYAQHQNTKAMMLHGIGRGRALYESLGATDIRETERTVLGAVTTWASRE